MVDKSELDRWAARLPKHAIVGTVMTREATCSLEHLSASTLLALLLPGGRGVRVFEQADASYMLMFNPELGGRHALVGAPTASPLVSQLRRYEATRSNND